MITTNQKPIIKRQKNKEEGIELTLKKTIKPQGKIIREDERSKRIFYQPDSRWKEFFPHSYTLWELKKQNKTKQNKKNTKQTKIYPSHPPSPKPVKR